MTLVKNTKIRFAFLFVALATLLGTNQVYANSQCTDKIVYTGTIVDKIEFNDIIYWDNHLGEYVGVYILDNDDVLSVHSVRNYDVETWASSGTWTYLDAGELWSWEIGDRVEKHVLQFGEYENDPFYKYYKNLEHEGGSISGDYQSCFKVENISSRFFNHIYVTSPEWLVNKHWWNGTHFPSTLEIPRHLGWNADEKILLAIGYTETEENACGWWTYWEWFPAILNLNTKETFSLPVIHTTSYDGS